MDSLIQIIMVYAGLILFLGICLFVQILFQPKDLPNPQDQVAVDDYLYKHTTAGRIDRLGTLIRRLFLVGLLKPIRGAFSKKRGRHG